jgi:hypothetical protein
MLNYVHLARHSPPDLTSANLSPPFFIESIVYLFTLYNWCISLPSLEPFIKEIEKYAYNFHWE